MRLFRPHPDSEAADEGASGYSNGRSRHPRSHVGVTAAYCLSLQYQLGIRRTDGRVFQTESRETLDIMTNGVALPFNQTIATDQDAFTVRNDLGIGQSDASVSTLSAVVGHSDHAHGVHGISGPGGGTAPQDPTDTGTGTGVWGESAAGYGVYGASGAGSGHPAATPATGVYGSCANGNGVSGASANWNGVEGDSWSPGHAGVAGVNNAGGPAIWGSSAGNAGEFHGKVYVTGEMTVDGADLIIKGDIASVNTVTINGDIAAVNTVHVNNDVIFQGADCAEHFDVAVSEALPPGTVVVIDPDGSMRQCQEEYDKTVAGVVSGADAPAPNSSWRQFWAPAMLFAECGDVLVERLEVVGGRRGVSSALEDSYGGGVGTAVGFLKDLVAHPLVDHGCVGRVGGLAAFGESQPQVASELLLCGGLRGVPGELRVAVAQQRVDERARVTLAQRGAGGVVFDRPGVDRLGRPSEGVVARE